MGKVSAIYFTNTRISFPLEIFGCIVLLMAVLTLSGCSPSLPVDKQPSPTIIQATATSKPMLPDLPATATLPSTPTLNSTPNKTEMNPAQAITIVFIGETIPDGTNLEPRQAFQKTWTLKNGGNGNWAKGISLGRTSSTPDDEFLGSPQQIPLADELKPGESIQIAVDLVAPQQDGRYSVYYQLQDENGDFVPDSLFWVTITVGTASYVNTSGVSAQLRSAAFQAGEVTVDFCMQLPDERAWYPWNVILTVDSQQISPEGSLIDPLGATTANKCFSFGYPLSNLTNRTFQLSIGKVELPPEVHQAENCARAQTTLKALYPGLDFTCTGPGVWYAGLVLPTGMTSAEADTLILDAMSSTIYGPWILTGNVP